MLVSQFEEAMVDIYRRALSEAKYKASRFLSMVQEEGGLATARYLIHAPQVSDSCSPGVRWIYGALGAKALGLDGRGHGSEQPK